MTVVVRDQQTPMGMFRVVQVERTHFNCLLRAQRDAPICHQWAGARFRHWRRERNNAAKAAADYAECRAFIANGGNEQTRAGSQHPFAVIQGGRSATEQHDHAFDSVQYQHSAMQEARQRWRETDGFARIE